MLPDLARLLVFTSTRSAFRREIDLELACLTGLGGRDIISSAAWDLIVRRAAKCRGAGWAPAEVLVPFFSPDKWICRSVAEGREMEFAAVATRELTVSSGSFDAKERVKQAVDIVDLVGSHIQLRRQGRNYVGLCPWHDDTRPSLQVNPERQSFKCWVCDIGGDVFSFVMKMEGVEFREALEMLADRAGISIEKPRRQPAAAGEAASGCGRTAGGTQMPSAGRPCRQANAVAGDGLGREAVSPLPARIAPRPTPPAAICKSGASRPRASSGSTSAFRRWNAIGFCEASKARRAREASQRRAKILETIGILARPAEGGSLYDRFQGRLLFSIHDAQGRPVGIGGRVLPELGTTSPAKYVNSPETPLFTKSKLLYGLDLAREALRKSRTALVMEGYTDVIVAHQYGFQNAVAVLGTALGESHVRF